MQRSIEFEHKHTTKHKTGLDIFYQMLILFQTIIFCLIEKYMQHVLFVHFFYLVFDILWDQRFSRSWIIVLVYASTLKTIIIRKIGGLQKCISVTFICV